VFKDRYHNRKLDLSNLFLGEQCAELISNWILTKQIEISVLILRNNCIGDSGLAKLANAVCIAEIIHIDLTSNGLTNKCADSLFKMLRSN